jgi:hypothetical protein
MHLTNQYSPYCRRSCKAFAKRITNPKRPARRHPPGEVARLHERLRQKEEEIARLTGENTRLRSYLRMRNP